MIKIKHKAFTLSEVLITLTIVGVLAAFVLPGLIRETTTKANMSLLQSTVSNLTDAIQQEIFRKNAKKISDTTIFNNPEQFLKDNFDYAVESDMFNKTGEHGQALNAQYKTLSGGTTTLSLADRTVVLKNGVYIALIDEDDSAIIDLNGPEPPNVVGIDLFEVEIAKTDDLTNGIHLGDVGGFRYDDVSNASLLADCKTGSARKCYALVERSGFNHNYLEEIYNDEYTKKTDTSTSTSTNELKD